jgi:quinol---cytochrome c reductase iron-sulfur subunit, bacillus type
MNQEPEHPLPVEPTVSSVAEQDHRGESRRSFLFKLSIAINGAVALLVATPVIRYLLGPVSSKEDYYSWIALGKVDDYKPGNTVLATYQNPYRHPWDGETANVACYVRRQSANSFTIFAVNCAHLGCPVRWFPQSQLFLCPCHGGAYYADGSRAADPPERDLFTYQYRIDGDTLMIRAGQMPTLSNEARLRSPGGCAGMQPSGVANSQLIKGITPCPKAPVPGTSESTIG